MGSELPTGTVTFLFTDIEGSTKLLHELGVEAYGRVLAEHRGVLREASASRGGVEVGTEGDAFFAAFPSAPGAVAAARQAQQELARGPLRVRMGLHTGTAQVVDEDYVGTDVHLAARIAAAAHGGQVLVSASTAALVSPEGLIGLGTHQLKDFARPLKLFQSGSKRFPPLRTVANTNLPRPVSSFVGRDREVAEVVSLLREEARLVTLTGPGGIGKTRLGVKVASELVPEFGAGVFWVGLAPLRDPGLVVTTMARTLGAEDGLADHIGEREMLLLLDNLEHVIGVAPELSTLLEACPNLRFLVTSRQLLRVRGEVEYRVPPLAEEEGVALFAARSQVEPDPMVAELCRALESLPLAIELAAARTAILAPAKILERLGQRLDVLKGGRDAEARQETLRAAIDWSHELLSPEEQTLFARLAVFRAGSTLQAVEVVAEASLDTLQSLVEKSLLRHTNGRYRMLETIREYAAERLEAMGAEVELRQRHADWFLTLAEEAYPNLGESPQAWLDRLEADHDNLRASLDHYGATSQTQHLQRLTGALWRFWDMRGHLAEGVTRLEEALAADQSPTVPRARALLGSAAMAVAAEQDFPKARLRAEEAFTLHEKLGDPWGSAYSRFLFGHVAVESGDFAAAPPHLEDCLRLFGQLGDQHYMSVVAFNLSWAYDELGEHERARALAEEYLQHARARGNARDAGGFLDLLAPHAQREGRLDDALSMHQESLRINRDLGDRIHIADSLSRIAAIHATTGAVELAARLLASAVAANEELRVTPLYQRNRNEETLAVLHAHLDQTRFDAAWELGLATTIEDSVALALEPTTA